MQEEKIPAFIKMLTKTMEENGNNGWMVGSNVSINEILKICSKFNR